MVAAAGGMKRVEGEEEAAREEGAAKEAAGVDSASRAGAEAGSGSREGAGAGVDSASREVAEVGSAGPRMGETAVKEVLVILPRDHQQAQHTHTHTAQMHTQGTEGREHTTRDGVWARARTLWTAVEREVGGRLAGLRRTTGTARGRVLLVEVHNLRRYLCADSVSG